MSSRTCRTQPKICVAQLQKYDTITVKFYDYKHDDSNGHESLIIMQVMTVMVIVQITMTTPWTSWYDAGWPNELIQWKFPHFEPMTMKVWPWPCKRLKVKPLDQRSRVNVKVTGWWSGRMVRGRSGLYLYIQVSGVSRRAAWMIGLGGLMTGSQTHCPCLARPGGGHRATDDLLAPGARRNPSAHLDLGHPGVGGVNSVAMSCLQQQ